MDALLQFNEYEILKNAGKVSQEIAKTLAEGEYEKYRLSEDRRYVSEFKKEVKKIEGLEKSWRTGRKMKPK